MHIIQIKTSSSQQKKTKKSLRNIYFTRNELSTILSTYSTRVAEGIWKDYALDYTTEYAAFSIFRNTNEKPIYMIEKNILSNKGSLLFTLLSNRKKLIRSSDLYRVLNFLNRTPKLLSSY